MTDEPTALGGMGEEQAAEFRCPCDLCVRTREFTSRLQRIPESERAYFDSLYEAMLNSDMDADHSRAIIDGSWPDADTIIDGMRKRAGNESPVARAERAEAENARRANWVCRETYDLTLQAVRVEVEARKDVERILRWALNKLDESVRPNQHSPYSARELHADLYRAADDVFGGKEKAP